MNIRSRTILIAGAWIAAVSASSAQAANPNPDPVEQQMQITDGYYPQYAVHPAQRQATPETQARLREDGFFKEGMAITDGYYPRYTVYPTATQMKLDTPQQARADKILQQMGEEDGGQ